MHSQFTETRTCSGVEHGQTDMTIEQSLMRSGKTHGGLVNITHKESARTKWLLTAHIVAQYSEALRKLAENAGGTWSEQHQKLYQGSRIRDHDDLKKLQDLWLITVSMSMMH